MVRPSFFVRRTLAPAYLAALRPRRGAMYYGSLMLLIRHSTQASNAVRTVSPGGELFVASVVIFMILASFGDAIDVAMFGEVGLEFALFDFGGEISVLAMRHWHLLQLLAAGGALAAGISVLRIGASAIQKRLRPAPSRAVDKVPI